MANELRRCCDCGQPITTRARFCPRCGSRQPHRKKIHNLRRSARHPGRN
jgi:predicted amidophosphoribosyltransferase